MLHTILVNIKYYIIFFICNDYIHLKVTNIVRKNCLETQISNAKP